MEKSNQNKANQQPVPGEHMAVGSKTGHGFLTGPGLYEFPVDYVNVNGIAIHEGCIELGTIEEVEAEAQRIRSEHLNKTTIDAAGDDESSQEDDVAMGVGLPTNSSFLWPNGVVPYTIAADVPDTSRVDDAIQHIELNTAIRFVRRNNQNAEQYPNYVQIISNGNESWSSSQIGMRGTGRQLLRYSNRHSWKILVHEFLHALGQYHEQSRSDRDEFVEIRWDNIKDGPPPDGEINALGNFQKKSGAADYFDYDYGSIMHYPGTSFAKDSSKPTIVPLTPGVTIGQREKMSYGDRQTIAKMYQRFFPRGYSGVWRAGTGPYGLWVNASWTSFRNKWQEWSRQGLRLHDIHVHRRGNRTLYSGVFLSGGGRYGLWANVGWSSFQNKWQEWSRQGLRLVDFHIHRSGNQNKYSGVFLPGSGGYGLWANVSWNSFRNKWQEWNRQGLRLVDIHVHRVGSQTRYSGIFLPGTGGHGLWANVSWASFTSKWREWSNQGLRLVDLNLHRTGNSTRYSGVFLPGVDSHYLWANVTYQGFRAKWQELAEQGLRLIDFEVVNTGDGSADVADISLANTEEDSQADLEEFGGIYGMETSSDDLNQEKSLDDGGGGLGDRTTHAPTTLADTSEVEGNGGSHFLNSLDEQSEDEEGLGGAYFDIPSSDQPTEEPVNHGGAVLPVGT
ncbi:MAG: hypothetical protein NPIRA04_11080 [Nitrospirales bacterium]|nr:MAG: hypothetical protein NPIRA04_11080 [Nitrospirales bacterium]